MKFCKTHWSRLRAEIEANGLSHMITSKEVLFQTTVDALEGKDTSNAPFDPLMAMHNKIVERFMDPLGANGLYLFTGDYCPLCELDRLNPNRDLPENWIVNGTKSLAQYLRANDMTDEILNESEVRPV